VIVVALVAFALGYFASTLKKAYDNRDKLEGGLEILSGLGKIAG
jgi:hypothetical protein